MFSAIAQANYGPVAPHILAKVKEALPEGLSLAAEGFSRPYGP